MAGFPTRILRSTLGQKLRDPYPPEHPEYEAGAARLNLLEQVATAANLLIPRCVVIAEYTTLLVVRHREEAWNTDHAQIHPNVASTGTGVYVVQFATSYLDEDGISRNLALVYAEATAMADVSGGYGDRLDARAWVDGSDPSIVRVRVFNSSGTLVHAPWKLEVW